MLDSGRSRRPYHRGLSDPIIDLDRSLIWPRLKHYLWLGGQRAFPKRGRQYLSAVVVGAGYTLLLLSPWGSVIERTQRMFATLAVATCEISLMKFLVVTRCEAK